jgi:hypothetical protein
MVLRGAAGAVLALPLLDDVPLARAQATAPIKRLIVMFSPNGTIPSAWHSTNAPFTPGPIFSELVAAGHQNDLIIFEGLDMKAAMDGPGGDAHGLGIGCLLTGTELAAGNMFQAGMGGAGSGYPTGISVDQYIAQTLQAQNPRRFASIDFTVKRAPGDLWTRMSYSTTGGPPAVDPYDDPMVAFDKIFAGVGGSTTSAAATRLAGRRKSVIDGVMGELKTLGGSLSGQDQSKINHHLEVLRQMEISLGVNSSTGCPVPPRPTIGASTTVTRNASGMEYPLPPSADSQVPDMHLAIRKLLVSAMSCDLTRVATVMMAPSRSDVYTTWLQLPLAKSHHTLSHVVGVNAGCNPSPTPPAVFSAATCQQAKDAEASLIMINQWYAKQVAEMITLLKSVREGNGTMFDSTVVLWANELGIGNSHSHTNIPLMLAGTCGGYFKTGQAIQAPSGTPHNRLLISLCNAMGIPTMTFGNPKHCTGGAIL